MGALFGTGAPAVSDYVAVFEIAVAVVLLAGMFVIRAGRVRLHRYMQSSMVLVNVPVILAWMMPHYLASVAPDVSDEIGILYYLIPTAMLVAGAAAEALGIYILAVAGTNLLPERLRFRRYKRWMRTELVLWWAVVLLGLTTYYVWYVSV
jgi:uncharacterized membrane protein YozB (DUF420 family)